MDYRREIDGLRALAVIPVILFHAGFQTFSGGFVGVDVFFVISGYLITTIILTELNSGKFSITNFYERRVRRIIPALFLVMAVCLPSAWLLLLPEDFVSFSKSFSYVPAFLSNFLFHKQSGYFDVSAELKPLLHTWSLAVEEQYYIFFPVLLIATRRIGNRFNIFLMIFIFMASLVYANYKVGINPSSAFYLLPSRLWEILVGSFVGYYYTNHNLKIRSHTSEQLASLLGLTLIIYAIFAFDSKTPFPSFYTLIPTIGAALIIVFANHKTIVGKLLGMKLMLGIGLISYSAYLWHQPLFAFTRHSTLNEPSLYLMALLVIVSFVFAYLTWKYVERPFRNKHRFSRKQVFVFAGFVSFLYIGIGLIGQQTKGFINFYNKEQLKIIQGMENAGDYTWKPLHDLHHKEFEKNTYKIMVIGDSYSGDFLNAVFESYPAEHISFSSHVIDGVCGNLYVEDNLLQYIDAKFHKRCLGQNWYGDEKLIKLIRQANEVWLISSWKEWQLSFLNQSLINLENEFGEKFLIVGRKSFGKKIKKIQLSQFSTISIHELKTIKTALPENHIKINNFMKNNIPSDKFFNLSEEICLSASECRLFDDNGNLISYDGNHLSINGARYIGSLISKKQRFSRFFNNKL